MAVLAALVGAAVVLYALYAEPSAPPVVVVADWGVLPTPGDLQRADFPTRWRGYDPGAVEAHLQAAAAAYADLLAVAPPDVIARARQRAAIRRGLLAPAQAPPPAPPSPPRPHSVADGDREELRVAAALGTLLARR